jgi:DNA polymerase-3 subunit beta
MKTTLLIKNLKAISRFCADGDIRYYLNGVKVESAPSETRLIATDGHILGCQRQTIGADENEEKGDFIIPFDTVKTILRWKAPSKVYNDIPVVFTTESPTQIRAQWGDNIVVFSPVEGKFPDYHRVIPSQLDQGQHLYSPDLIAKLAAAAIDINGKSKVMPYAFGFNGAGLALINDNFIVVIMEIKGDILTSAAAADWARSPITTI